MSTLRKPPHHVLLVIGDCQCKQPPVDQLQKTEIAVSSIRNLIQSARPNGVGYLTICCSGDRETHRNFSSGGDLRAFFESQSSDPDWLADTKVNMRYVDDLQQDWKSDPDKLNLTLIPVYDGRAELVKAVKKVLEKIENGELVSNDISRDMLNENISFCDMPDPDLVIFTGGLTRLENSFLWQSAYAEFAFINEQWQDLSQQLFEHLLADYRQRDRRFGGLTSPQKKKLFFG